MPTTADAIESAYVPGSQLPHSVLKPLVIPAPFRRWGSPVKVEVPWGLREYWNVIVTMESIGLDETQNWQDNIFIHQQIKTEKAESPDHWNVSGICFYTFWNPPAANEPGISIHAQFLAVLK